MPKFAELTRPLTKPMEDLAYKGEIPERYQVLDHGFVQVVKVMDTDQDIVEIARVTTAKRVKKHQPTKRLLRYLWHNQHTSPFGFPTLRLLIRAPLFVARQWFRHRTSVHNEVETPYESDDPSASQYHEMQEFSGRYQDYDDEMYLPPIERMQKQAESNHQGSSIALIDTPLDVQFEMGQEQMAARESRNYYLTSGLARELARINTPLSQYTEFYWQQSLLNLLHFLELRRAKGAQYEIRAYAQTIEQIVKQYFPLTYEVWLEWVKGLHITEEEAHEIVHLLSGMQLSPNLYEKLTSLECLEKVGESETDECAIQAP